MKELDVLYLGCECDTVTPILDLGRYWPTQTLHLNTLSRRAIYSTAKALVIVVDADHYSKNITQLFQHYPLLQKYSLKICLYLKPPTVINTQSSAVFDLILLPPYQSTDLYQHLEKILQDRQSTQGKLLEEFLHLNLRGSSPAFINILKLIKQVSHCDVPVLIEGETGTGKENAARALHYLSPRRDKAFIPVNCGAIPDSLFESELFGFERGSFTDATRKQQGIVAIADNGTLFLDEVDSLSLKAQAALLRFLQTGEFRSLGGKALQQSDVRVVAATNANLEAVVAEGIFREDLFFRLNVLRVNMPPLRDRAEDIVEIAKTIISNYAVQYDKAPSRIHPATLQWLRQQPWRGNVRELENVLLREFLLSNEPELRIAAADDKANTDSLPGETVSKQWTGFGDKVREMPTLFKDAKETAINDFEKNYLRNILSQTGGNISEAARLAGKERRSLGKLIKKYNIDKNQFA